MPSPRLKPCLLALGLLFAGNLHAEAPRQTKPAQGKNSAVPLNSAQLLAQMLLSEIALARGLIDDAAFGYNDLARRSGDPRIQLRANEIDLARLLLLMQQNPDDAEETLRKLLAEQPAGRERLILQLPGLYGRNSDKAYVLRTVQKLLQPYQSMAEAHFSEALVQRDIKDPSASYAAALRAHRLKPDWEPPLLLLADLAGDAQREEVSALLATYLQRNPRAHDLGIAQIRLMLQGQQKAEARETYLRLIQTPPERPEVAFALAGVALEFNDLATAESLLEKLLEQNWGEADRLQLILGQIEAERGNTAKAIQTFDGVAPGPHYVNAQANKARLLARNQQLPEARAGLAAARRAMPEERAAIGLQEAQLLREQGDQRGALAVLEEELKLQPDHVDVLYDAALLAEQLGKPALMEQRLRRILNLKPDHAHALNALGYSFADRNQHLDEAEQLLTQALQLAPQDAAILDSMGWLRFRQKRFDLAEPLLRQAYALFPDPEVASHLIEVLWSAGKRDDARLLWQENTTRNPANELLTRLGKRLGL
ncbi:tetratricopeptide repeat protein [Uliginosibacterium sp. TH139]|uniref:tetratricopeptide repeat protein n=1 Tax=Uliginosibacterium sp. TH139 TaxID=2067453 RepID=UPI000C7C54F6|nr:tetratricopeptide repeat protein [Uliginosibacterium sp. TH139]PLK47963.1 hypothetical protein C0V76_14435 [Uliginosibacterium sp. TH139]